MLEFQADDQNSRALAQQRFTPSLGLATKPVSAKAHISREGKNELDIPE